MTDILQNINQPAWDEYATVNNTGLFSHSYDWGEILAVTYRLQIFRLAIRNEAASGKISGILPLILFDSPNREKRLISLPYTDSAGIIADDTKSRDKLLIAALSLANEVGALHVELRQAGNCNFQDPIQELSDHWSYATHTFKTGLLRPLPETPAEMWDLGSPVNDPDLFRQLLAKKSLTASVVLISIGALPVAAAIVFKHHSTLFNPWASSLRRWRPSCPNMLLYWTMLVNHQLRPVNRYVRIVCQ
jgi:hypothetical protein